MYILFSYQYINMIWFCCHMLAMSNSCYNPFIYLLCNVSVFAVCSMFRLKTFCRNCSLIIKKKQMLQKFGQ